MIVEIGHFAAILAFIFCAAGIICAAKPLYAQNLSRYRLIVYFTRVNFLLLSLSMLSLILAYLQSDFTVVNVAANSHTMKPWLYKLAGAWGNHEGSVLFWSWILSLYGFAFSYLEKNLDHRSRFIVMTALMIVAICFLAYLIAASNPFLRQIPYEQDGRDLNPLLQDPGLAFHPPLLYLGYVGSAMMFGFAVAALMQPEKSAEILHAMRGWAAMVWSFLTLGIALGSYWAYYELGWGGWWFWDPVENASLMPWILCTALLHSVMIAKRQALAHATILLSLCTFGLSLIGTFLVRSGILTSVHAFADDPRRGLFLLFGIAAIMGGAFILYARRIATIPAKQDYGFLSRETGIALNNMILSVLCFTVFLGTLYPLFVELYNGGKLSVGTPYFTMTFVPISVPLLLLMICAPFLTYRATPASNLWRPLAQSAILGAILSAALILQNHFQFFPAAMMWIACGIIAGSLIYWRRAFKSAPKQLALWPRLRQMNFGAHTLALGHAGLGICMIGMIASTAYLTEDIQKMSVGQKYQLGDYRFELQSIDEGSENNYAYVRAKLLVEETGQSAFYLFPEKRLYPSQGAVTTEAARDPDLLGDVYTALAEVAPDKSYAIIRLSYHPLVLWIWVGAMIMALAGFLQSIRSLTAKPQSQHALPGDLPFSYKPIAISCGIGACIYAVIGSPIFLFF